MPSRDFVYCYRELRKSFSHIKNNFGQIITSPQLSEQIDLDQLKQVQEEVRTKCSSINVADFESKLAFTVLSRFDEDISSYM